MQCLSREEMSMFTDKMFDTGIVSLNVAEGPAAGPPLVLLHGISACWQTFLSIMPPLAFRYQLYGVELRGHGRSGRVPGAYHLEHYAQDTLALLRQQIAAPAVLLGHSLGGLVAIQVAAAAADAVRALVLEDPPLYGHRGARLRARTNYRRFMAWRDLAQTDYAMEVWVAELAKLEPESDAAALR